MGIVDRAVGPGGSLPGKKEGLWGTTLTRHQLAQAEAAREIAERSFHHYHRYLQIDHVDRGKFSEVEIGSGSGWSGGDYQVGTLPFATRHPDADFEAIILYGKQVVWEPLVAQGSCAMRHVDAEGKSYRSPDSIFFSYIFDFIDGDVEFVLRKGLAANAPIAHWVLLDPADSLFQGFSIDCDWPRGTHYAEHNEWPTRYEVRRGEDGLIEVMAISHIMNSTKDIHDVEVVLQSGNLVSIRSGEPVIEILSSPWRINSAEKEYRHLTETEIQKIVERTQEACQKARTLLHVKLGQDPATPSLRFNLPRLLAWAPRTIIEARFGDGTEYEELKHRIKYTFGTREIKEEVEVVGMPGYPRMQAKILVHPKDYDDPHNFDLESVTMLDWRNRKMEAQYAHRLADRVVCDARKLFPWIETR